MYETISLHINRHFRIMHRNILFILGRLVNSEIINKHKIMY